MRFTRRSLLAVTAVLSPAVRGARAGVPARGVPTGGMPTGGLPTRGGIGIGGGSLAGARADILVLDPWSDGHVLLRRPSGGDGLILPALRARIATWVTLAGRELTLTVFAADPDAQSTLDLLAITSIAAGAPPRLIGLEVLDYAHADGTRLSTTLAATSDGSRIVFTRTASVTISPTLVTRAAWKDYLMWSDDDAPLADAPIHPPPPRSWPELLSIRRFRVRVALIDDIAEITPALLADTHLQHPLRP